MILDRTIRLALTLRKVIPTSSQIVTLAEVILAWIQRLKYFARKMLAMSAMPAMAMIINQKYVCQEDGFTSAAIGMLMGLPQIMRGDRPRSLVVYPNGVTSCQPNDQPQADAMCSSAPDLLKCGPL